MPSQTLENTAGKQRRTAFVLGASADIGAAISTRLIRDGWNVVGTGRSAERLAALENDPAFAFMPCDLADRESILRMVRSYGDRHVPWSLFVSAAGTMEPIGPFFGLDFDAWEQSVIVNSTAQLRVLHGLWPHRQKDVTVDVMLMAGGGTNNPFTNYSAYCVSKIALIKMAELLDDEEKGLNIFINGPGYVKTRIHEETLKAGNAAGMGLAKTVALLEGEGTPMDDIYGHLQWCMLHGRAVSSGRNFSTQHDPWKQGELLADRIRGDANAFRLRRAPASSKG